MKEYKSEVSRQEFEDLKGNFKENYIRSLIKPMV